MIVTDASPCSQGKHRWSFDGRSAHALPGCDRPNQMRCGGCGAVSVVRCRSSRSRCAPCSKRYQRNVSRIARSGLVLLPGREYFLTLTAPGEREHLLPSGAPCPCTSESNKLDDAVSLAVWNGESVHRWNRLHQAIERHYGVKLSYFRATEVQDRGALHFHVIIRVESPCKIRVSEVRKLAIRHNFGHAVDVRPVEDKRAAWYVAKYVTKCSDERELVPYLNRRTGELGPGRWRTWTSSRSWGESMRSLRASQRDWVLEQRKLSGEDPGTAEPATGCAGGAGALDHWCLRYAEGRLVMPSASGSVPM